MLNGKDNPAYWLPWMRPAQTSVWIVQLQAIDGAHD